MAGFFDDTENTTSPVAKSFFDDTETKPIPARTVGSTLKDLAISTGRGALEIPGMVTGLADLPFALTTGTRPFDTAANYIGEKTGLQPHKLADKLAEDYSPIQKQSATDIQKVWDDSNTNALDVAKAYVTHPGYVANQVVESVPSMLAGGVVSKGIMGAGKLATLALPAVEGAVEGTVARQGAGILERKLADRAVAKLGIDATPEAIAAAQEGAYKSAAAIAGGAGEGIVQVGQAMDQSKGEDQRKNAIAALGSGLIDAVIATGAGKLAQHLGFETAETAMAKSFNDRIETEVKTGLTKYGKAGEIAGGAISEGILQELPQSAQEQVFQNYADDKPLWDGVNRAAVEGALAGFVMGAGANVVSGKEGNIKTPEEIELNRRAGNILSQDKDQINQSIQSLTNNIKSNQDILSDDQKLYAQAKELNIEPIDLVKQILAETNDHKSLLDKINQGIADQDKNAQVEKQAAYGKLSPEDKAAKDVVDKLAAQRIADAQNINTNLDAFKTQEAALLDQYGKEQDPEKKKVIEENVFALRKEKNDLLDKQQAQQNQQTQQPGQEQQFEKAKTADELRQEKESFYNQTWADGVNKDAAESAKVFEDNKVQQENMLQQILHEKDVQKKQELQSTMDMITKESDPVVRQKLYNQMFEQPGVKNAQESEEVFLTQNFTEREKAVVEDYWQGVKKELNQNNEKMTPGTEAFMRQKFFETKLGEIEGNVKSDAAVTNDVNKKVTIPLAEQNKRQAWFQKTAKELGDFAKTNPQAITPEVPRNLPGGITDSFTNEQQVHEGPQLPIDESTSVNNFDVVTNEFKYPKGSWLGDSERTIAKLENLPSGTGIEETGKALGNPSDWSMTRDEALLQEKKHFATLENSLKDTHSQLNDEQINDINLTQAKQETNLGNILETVKSADGLTGQLANFLSDFITSSKLNIKVIIDPTVKSASYTGGKVNTITLRNPSQLTSSLHEITHAVTVREMQANPAIREQVKLLMKRVENKAIKEALITPAQVALLRTETTSRGYKENITGNIKFENIAYGLLNENEFLAQAMGSEQFQSLLKATTIADKGMLRNAWDTFVEVVMKALGIQGTHKNAFGEALSIIAKLASQENINGNNNLTISEELGTTEQKISDDTYNNMFKEQNSLVRTIGQTLRMRGHEIKQLIDKGLGSISTRLKNVDPMLRAEIRNLDFRTSQKIVSALRIAHPLLEKTKVMSPEDKFTWDAARRNSDEVKIKQIAEKYGMTADQEKLRTVLDNIRQEAIDVGYDVGFIEEYWPRIIKDQEGFLEATKGISQRPVITDAIKVLADKLGMSVEQFELAYPERAADIASNTILGRNLGLGGPGNIQARQYETVPPELNKFYMNSDAALMQYIYSMTKKIETRKFFGKVPERIANLKAEKSRKSTMLAEYEKTNNTARMEDVSNDLIRIEQELDKYKLQRDYTENIGTYINDLRMNGRIQADDEKVVRDILDARFHEHGTTGPINAYKNMAYIDVMGSPLSALTQIGDLAWAMYVGKIWTPKGLSSTIKNLVKATIKKSEITKEDLGIERIAQEFADGTTLGNAVSWVFKKVGLEYIDSIGKEVLINNALDNYKHMASTEVGRKTLLKQINPIFGTQSGEVIKDLLAGNPTDNIKMLLYHRVLDFQPVGLSEMPEQYLKSGNGRIFYMLKTFTLKQFDVLRNEVWHKIKTGERDQVIEGIGNMIKLVSLLTLANAGADELKDWMLGKETKFSDHVIENFLTIGGASRFIRMQTTKEGIGSGLAGQVMPPFRFVNSLSKDAVQIYGNYVAGDTINFNNARIMESLPVAGKLYYWHYGRGEEYKKSINEQEFKDIGKDVDLFKKQLGNATDKRTFLTSNLDKFKQMKLHDNFQAALTRNQAVVNKLKKIPETTNVLERLGQLKQQKEVILNKYFEVAKGMQ